MARGLKLDLIAEGVETRTQLKYLKSQGCREVQGYHLQPPDSGAGVHGAAAAQSVRALGDGPTPRARPSRQPSETGSPARRHVTLRASHGSRRAMAGFTTTIVHSDRRNPIEHGSLHKPVHSNVAYGYDDARELAAVFQGRQKGYSYGARSIRPSKRSNTRSRRWRTASRSVCFTTGMGAIGTMLFALLRAGDHFVSSAFLFGNTNSLFASFANHGVDVTFVDATSVDAVEAAIRPNTRLVFVETIANPRTQVADLEAIGALCRSKGSRLRRRQHDDVAVPVPADDGGREHRRQRVDEIHCGSRQRARRQPDGTRPLRLAALSEHRVGISHRQSADVGTDADQEERPARFRRGARTRSGAPHRDRRGNAGAAPRAAVSQHADAGRRSWRAIRAWRRCFIRGSPSHPQHALAKRLFRHPGALFSFELDPNDRRVRFSESTRRRHQVEQPRATIARSRFPSRTRSTTKWARERRASMGIADSLIRISVGIEDTDDLLDDFEQALSGSTSLTGEDIDVSLERQSSDHYRRRRRHWSRGRTSVLCRRRERAARRSCPRLR